MVSSGSWIIGSFVLSVFRDLGADAIFGEILDVAIRGLPVCARRQHPYRNYDGVARVTPSVGVSQNDAVPNCQNYSMRREDLRDGRKWNWLVRGYFYALATLAPAFVGFTAIAVLHAHVR